MPITKVPHVSLIAQRADGVCWCASALMLYKWSINSGHAGMKDPLADSGMKWRWDNNKDWSSSDNAFLASTLAMKTHGSIPADYSGLNTFFVSHGPIWAAGQKNWGGNNHGHVVVTCGVADTGVFIHDPEPVGNGSSFWLTWAQWKKYVDGFTASVQFLTAM
jgi:hypothetical protein